MITTSRKPNPFLLSVAVSCLATIACSTEDPALGPPGSDFSVQANNIFLADDAGAKEEHNGVVLLFARSTSPEGRFSRSVCSATLVAPNLLLTAHHCVTKTAPEGFRCRRNGEIVSVIPNGGTFGASRALSNLSIHSGKRVDNSFKNPIAQVTRIIGTDAKHMCENDLAFVVLDRELDMPLFPLRMEKDTQRGEPVTAIGYGFTESLVPFTRRAKSDLHITGVGARSAADPPQTSFPRSVTVGTGPCQGDSGGPLLSNETGAIIGPFSVVTPENDCGHPDVVAVYTRLRDFGPIVDEAFEAAGYEPWIEGEAYPPHLRPPVQDAGGISDPSLSAMPNSTNNDQPNGRDDDAGRRLRTGCSVTTAPKQRSTISQLSLVLALFALWTWRRSERRVGAIKTSGER